MAITGEGLTIKRYDEILTELETSLRSFLGNNIDLTENALLGIMNIIYANSQAEQWEMAQAVYNAFNIEGATDKQLDDLVALIGLTRLAESASTGILEIGGVEGTLVGTSVEFETSDTSKLVFLDNAVNITSSACFKTHSSITAVVAAFNYLININGVDYSYVAIGTETVDDIMNLLTIQINTDSSAPWSASFTPSNGYMEIVAFTNTFSLAVQLTTNQQFDTIFSSGQASLQEIGKVEVLANTVTVINTPVTGLNVVTNSIDFVVGRLEETDEELRARHSQSSSIIGSCSPSAIEAHMRALSGVTHAKVFENTSIEPDSRGLPPKSFEVVISGGSDTEITQEIYNEKPAGIETAGNTTGTAVDLDGQAKGVKYTRPVLIPVHVDVVYSLYDEESFPANGNDLIRQAVVDYIDTLIVDEDVIAQRLFGAIFGSVSGLLNLTIKLGYTSGTITESNLPIAEREEATTTLANVSSSIGLV